MPVYCSFCHTRSDQPVEAGAASHVICHHCVCPRCKSEVGLEVIKPEVPNPMKLFGTLLAMAGFLVVVVSGLFVVAG